MSSSEFWQFVSSEIWNIQTTAYAAERDGWDGLVVTDSQNLSPDPYLALTLAAQATTSLKLGTGATNPVTRQSAVPANLAVALQELTAGRMVLGIARGDSALFNIGQTPASLEIFKKYIKELQDYLNSKTFELNGYPSQIRWLPQCTQPKVPIDIIGTGP